MCRAPQNCGMSGKRNHNLLLGCECKTTNGSRLQLSFITHCEEHHKAPLGASQTTWKHVRLSQEKALCQIPLHPQSCNLGGITLLSSPYSLLLRFKVAQTLPGLLYGLVFFDNFKESLLPCEITNLFSLFRELYSTLQHQRCLVSVHVGQGLL